MNASNTHEKVLDGWMDGWIGIKNTASSVVRSHYRRSQLHTQTCGMDGWMELKKPRYKRDQYGTIALQAEQTTHTKKCGISKAMQICQP